MGTAIAVVLFNLGGPDSPDAVQPFLFNLFNDPAILRLPRLIRWPLARVIATRRAKVAAGIYQQLGGASPLLAQTQAQAQALERSLVERGYNARVFVCMRYWHPRSDAVAQEVASWAPRKVILLPLYPQFSTTTTASSFGDWQRAALSAGLTAPDHRICCYSSNPGLLKAVARRIRNTLETARFEGPYRLLFSAHGLPKRIVAKGDPYQWQVERTVMGVLEALQGARLDYAICYQSRVGPLEWIGPSIEEELARAAADGVAVVVVPIAFVSEHSETLVELDIDYRRKASELGVPGYLRVATVGTAPEFIEGLADLVDDAISRRGSDGERRICPQGFGGCPTPERQDVRG